MQYSLMIYQAPKHFADRADPARRDANNAAFGRFVGALQEAGVLKVLLGIEPPDTGSTLHAARGAPRAASGPYADTDAQLGGLCVIEVPDLESAMAWAGRMPFDHCVAVEVRPTRLVSFG